MKRDVNTENPNTGTAGEDAGTARGSAAGRRSTASGRVAGDRRQTAQKRLDASHESDVRGEHRYADGHQTAAEQQARQERDDLKRRLARQATRVGPSSRKRLS